MTRETKTGSSRAVTWSPLAAIAATVAVVHLWFAVGTLHYGDFAMFHATARALSAGTPAYVAHQRSDGLWWNMNPPQFHLLMLPLAALSLPVAALVFRLLNAAAMVVAVALMFTYAELRSRRGGWIVVAALASPAVAMELGAAQVAGVLALGVALSWRALRTNRSMALGVLIGTICAWKPIFLPAMAWLMFARRWRAAGAAVAAASVWVALSIAVWGWTPQLAWIRAIGTVTWFDSRFNASWAVLVQRLVGREHVLSYRAIATVSLALALAISHWAARLRPADALAKCVVGSIACAPLGWIYYLPVAGPLLMRRAFDGAPWPWLAWALWMPLPLVPDVDAPFVVRITASSAYAWGMLALTLSRGAADARADVTHTPFAGGPAH